jgi:2-(1,2-epoxy-1,2-dihydrophenyl)acetyl-CoA isomerase
MGATYLLAHTLGVGWTRRMLLLGDKLAAETAHQLGLVARIGELGPQRQLATELIAEVERGAPRAWQSMKKLIDILPGTSLEDSRELELVNAYWLAHTKDVLEGVTAWDEERPPDYRLRPYRVPDPDPAESRRASARIDGQAHEPLRRAPRRRGAARRSAGHAR